MKKKIIVLRLILFCFIILIFKTSFCQNDIRPKFIKCKTELLQNDSDIILIPNLENLSKVKKIKIYKKLTFDDGNNNSSTTCRFFLQKYVRGFLIFIYTDVIKLRKYEDDESKLIVFGRNDKLNYEINLKNYYPFEIGTYRVKIIIDYFYKNKKLEVESDWEEFDVKVIPKNSLYNQ